MGEYSAPGLLHTCYSFDLLGDRLDVDHIRGCVEGFLTAAPDSWPMWAFSNHDVPRHVGRWAETDAGADDDVARLAVALLLALPGAACVYQGEELGLRDTPLSFDELVDPQSIEFWPLAQRDGARTPMPWASNEASAGFTTATPWLPIRSAHIDRAVDRQIGDPDSVLSFYRTMIETRRTRNELLRGECRFVDLDRDVLTIVRSLGDDELWCIFNLGADVARVEPPIEATEIVVSRQSTITDATVELGRWGFTIFAAKRASG